MINDNLKNKLFLLILSLSFMISSLAIVSSFQLFSQGQTEGLSENIVPPVDDSQLVIFDSIYLSSSSGLRLFKEIEQTISTQDQWNDFWHTIHKNHYPPPILPKVDFNVDLLIVASMGVQPHGGFSISITNIKIIENNLVISVTETSPGEECIVTGATVHPLEIVRIQQINFNQVIFERTSTINHCQN